MATADVPQYMLGMHAGLYRGTAGATSIGSMELVPNVQDLDLNMSSEKTSVMSRENSGWDANATTIKSCSVTFSILHRPGDPAFDAIQEAFLNSTPLAFAVLDAKAGGRGPLGDFCVSEFSESQKLKEAIINNVTLELTKFVEYIK